MDNSETESSGNSIQSTPHDHYLAAQTHADLLILPPYLGLGLFSKFADNLQLAPALPAELAGVSGRAQLLHHAVQ